jgi:hypothetical protein
VLNMKDKHVENILVKIASILNDLTPYQYIKSSALSLQGVELTKPDHEYISVQWDLFESVYTFFEEFAITQVSKSVSHAYFTMNYHGVDIQIECQFNHTVRTNPYRVSILKDGVQVWVQSIYAYLYDFNIEDRYKEQIHSYLSKLQNEVTQVNKNAWNQEQYVALVNRYGDQRDVAKKIKENPEWRLHPFYQYMGNIEGKKIVHLLGSNGIKE